MALNKIYMEKTKIELEQAKVIKFKAPLQAQLDYVTETVNGYAPKETGQIELLELQGCLRAAINKCDEFQNPVVHE